MKTCHCIVMLYILSFKFHSSDINKATFYYHEQHPDQSLTSVTYNGSPCVLPHLSPAGDLLICSDIFIFHGWLYWAKLITTNSAFPRYSEEGILTAWQPLLHPGHCFFVVDFYETFLLAGWRLQWPVWTNVFPSCRVKQPCRAREALVPSWWHGPLQADLGFDSGLE